MERTRWIFLGLFSLAAMSTEAYEITTHALVTDYAYRKSTLNPETVNSIVPVLGFDRLSPDQPFAFQGTENTSNYVDAEATADPAVTSPLPGALHERRPQDQELEVFDRLVRTYIPGSSGTAIEQRVRAWLMRGAIREDDNDFKFLGFWTTKDKRDDDPYSGLFRAFRHFYDPLLDRASENESLCADYGCVKSILWALGRTDPLNPGSDANDTSRRNHFTWQDARDNYWWALTLQRPTPSVASKERLHRWATTIKSLGHVIHLLQDTAQPQHVRNDLHGPPLTAFFTGDGDADGAFEAFTDYRVIRDYSASSAVAFSGNPLRRMVDQSLPVENNLPGIRLGQFNIYPGNGGIVQFSTPVKFFTTRHIEQGTDDTSLRNRRGLADLSNRSFFTASTLPGFRECQPPGAGGCVPTPGPTYPLPPNDLTDAGYTEISIPSALRVNGRVAFVSEFAHSITDRVAPAYDQSINTLTAYGGKAPLVTKGIWYDIIPDDLGAQFLETTGYTITYNNMRYMADVMLPRAVGYSAGMIDFFFRGRIKVEAPQDGMFSVTDQAIAHTVDSDDYPRCINTVNAVVGGEPPLCEAGKVFGFTKVRLKVRNDTPANIESGTATSVAQSMVSTLGMPGPNDARLVAIARYHRNRCYQSSLSGETVIDYLGTVTIPTCTDTTRTNFQEISVSEPAAMSNTALNGASSAPVTFTFVSEPIPINATDLVIQVVYRGQLGEEPDGIAVGRFDVREPSYLTLWNNSDYAGCNGNWVTSSGSGCTFTGGIARGIGTARLCINAQLLYTRQPGSGNGNILTGHYVRLAALLDDQSKNTRGRLLVGTANDLVIVDKSLTGQSRQAPMEVEMPTALYLPDPFFKKRGVIGSFRPMPFYLISGADPQPASDMGPGDVGSLAQVLNVPAQADTGGVISFPNTPPAPNSACTSTSLAPYFDDEIEAAQANGSANF